MSTFNAWFVKQQIHCLELLQHLHLQVDANFQELHIMAVTKMLENPHEKNGDGVQF